MWALVFNAGYLVAEGAAGLWTGSLALLSDATHMMSDVLALGLAVFAARLAQRPASSRGTFGLVRAEVLGAFLNALALLVACGLIFREAFERLVSGPPAVAGLPVLIVAVLGLIVNVGSALALLRGDRSNINIRGALAHMIADALGSVGAIVAACFVLAGYAAADAVVSVVIGVLVLASGWSVLKDSVWILLQFAPPGLGSSEISRALGAIEGVAAVHEVHVWALTSGAATVTAHLVAAEGAGPFEVLKRAEQALRAIGVGHTTIQVDPCEGPGCAQVECPALGHE
ncbi:MAG: cation transporter [Deltaproteobacteria bacterium]|nr:cation transporter [Deltaproteobacteria bacterium]